MPGPRKKRIPTSDGGTVGALIMPFQTSLESFNEYLVEDGTVIQIKLVATEILKVEDQYDDQGNPVYVISSQNVTSVSVPEHLRKQGD